MIQIQEGNDFDLCINARAISGDEDVPISFSAMEEFSCNLIKWTGTRIPMESLYVNNDGDLVIQVRQRLAPTIYAIELLGKYEGYKWRNCICGAFKIVTCACQSTVTDSETMTVDTYNFDIYIGSSSVTYKDMENYLAEHQFIDEVEVNLDNDEGVPSGDGTFVDGKLTLNLHNTKGERGNGIDSVEQVEESSEDGGYNTWRVTETDGRKTDIRVRNGLKGSQGTSAIWNAEADVLTELESKTGQATNRTMTQKAITDSIGITLTQAEYDALTPELNVKYIITEEL